MKKVAIFFIIIILIICAIFAMYISYKANYNISKKSNLSFEKYLNEEVYGSELATVINRAIDRNKNNKGIYQNNDTNSINIEIKMLDDDTIYQMETFYRGGIQNFINYYSNIKFKCVDIKYHSSTNQVKYMLFEQITS